MAKVSFNKLKCKLDEEIKVVDWNGISINVTQYLPVQKKLLLVQEVINSTLTELNYSNPLQIKIYNTLYILKYYTNISFTEKQSERPYELYDTLISSGFIDIIYSTIPQKELEEVSITLEQTIKAFYDYRTSVLGILDSLKLDYSDLNSQLQTVMSQVQDPEALATLKSILPLLN